MRSHQELGKGNRFKKISAHRTTHNKMFGGVFIKRLLYRTTIIVVLALAIFFIAVVSDIDLVLELHNLYSYIKQWVCFYQIWNGLKLFLKFLLVLCDIALQYLAFLLYYFAIFFSTVLDFISLFNPTLYDFISSIMDFVSWTAINIVQGIFLKSDCLTEFLSWIVVSCLSALYLDIKLRSRNCANRPERLNPNIVLEVVAPPETLQPRVTIQDLNYGIRQLNRRGPNRTVKSMHRQLQIRRRVQPRTVNLVRSNVPTGIEPTDQSSESFNSSDSDIHDNLLFGDARESLIETTDNQPVEAENSLECTICMLEKRNVAVFPCGHTHFCKSCVERIMKSSQKCPICTHEIYNYRHIFL